MIFNCEKYNVEHISTIDQVKEFTKYLVEDLKVNINPDNDFADYIEYESGSPWNGRQEVNGGYIVVKNNGNVVAFHSTIADEFKDFLVAKMRMESPSHSRHKDMVIYKDGDRYFFEIGTPIAFHFK